MRSWDYYQNNQQLREVINVVISGYFSNGDTNLFKPLVGSLLYDDHYMLLADYQSYIDCQDRVSQNYHDQNS
ncbi:Glycogen phosphorylase [Richelia intracellularis]|nr:Glycogen phosphorylase [Richelia intracellularis]